MIIRNNRSGFTLIEIIITLVFVSILATMMYTYFSGISITKSATPIIFLKTTLKLKAVMDNIHEDYLVNCPQASDLPGLQTRIGSEDATMSNYYGHYTVVDNHFVDPDDFSAPLPSSEKNILKVTIRGDGGEILTMLFAR